MSSTITPGSNRAQAQKFLLWGIRMELSNNQIYNQLVAGGLGYNKGNFGADMQRLRAAPLPRLAPIGSLTSLTSFSNFPPRLISGGTPRYQYIFTARTRNSLGQFNGGTLTWSFMTDQLLIPDIAMGIGIATAPSVSTERYSTSLPEDTVPVYENDIYGYDQPIALGSGEPLP